MALKAELEQWHQAVEAFDEQNYTLSLDIFGSIADSAKIHFNIGLIYGRQGNHKAAIQAYNRALELDKYLVVAYFQRGVAKMVTQENDSALSDFNNALKFLRDNNCIDYTQLGLEYKVYTCETLYNRALCYFCLGQEESARADLKTASNLVAEDRHSWIKKAMDSNGMDCPLYCVPKGVIYRPSASKIQSSKKIDFLGSAKVIASADGNDNFTGFKGALVRKETLKNASSIAHQKSMRIKKSTPPPETVSALARSNTMPANRTEPSSLPARIAPAGSFMNGRLDGPGGSRLGDNAPLSANANGYRGNPLDMPNVQVQVSDSELDDSEATSSAFTTPTTGSTNPHGVMSPDYPAPDRHDNNLAMPRSALKKSPVESPASQPAVDPLDIIRAGMARRATLKNQNRAQEKKPAGPQRSVTLKLPGRNGGYDEDEDDDDDDDEGHGYGQNFNPTPVGGPNSGANGRMRLNVGHLRGNSVSTNPAAAHMARNELIMPTIQRSNTDGTVQDMNTNYYNGASASGRPGDHPVSASGYAPPQHPGLASAQSMNPLMMTPPLSHEEVVSRGLAAMSVQNTHMPYASTQAGHIQTYASSSGANSPASSMVSPASGDPVNGAHYGSMGGGPMGGTGSTVGGPGGLRRAPTKKDSMKVKVHYGSEIINLMVPKHATFDVLHSKLHAKISSATSNPPSVNTLRIRYMDEDGEAVLMTDEDDFELAKAYAGGDMSSVETNVVERLELWCSTS
ncbi:hypothetical protein LPJ73_001401 [Coemansia sp. RSA 2703]|nr:hypothetical protein LPJ73_001401 [Coemansia sp. RSA 2703]KAJ2368233.1 hypothetical protein IW150_005465 [Coemansia sp. RSA 2607]KAJ2389599.1 hypothetical protein GGI05_003453 [Coemansia sp. RSA 2603]